MPSSLLSFSYPILFYFFRLCFLYYVRKICLEAFSAVIFSRGIIWFFFLPLLALSNVTSDWEIILEKHFKTYSHFLHQNYSNPIFNLFFSMVLIPHATYVTYLLVCLHYQHFRLFCSILLLANILRARVYNRWWASNFPEICENCNLSIFLLQYQFIYNVFIFYFVTSVFNPYQIKLQNCSLWNSLMILPKKSK